MLSSKHQVVLVMVVISLTIPNSIQDSFNNTKAISRAKKINIFGEAKIDRRDFEVSKEATTTLLKMPKLPRKVVLRKPKVKMTVSRYKWCGKKVPQRTKAKWKRQRNENVEGKGRDIHGFQGQLLRIVTRMAKFPRILSPSLWQWCQVEFGPLSESWSS